jgi:ABC-2 type transport system permease protein
MKPSNLVRDTMLLFWRALRVALRTPLSAFVFPIVFPLLTMIFVSQLTLRITALPVFPVHPYIAYLAPGTLPLVSMIGAGYAATGLVIDMNTGFLDRIRLLPTRAGAIICSKLLFDAARVLPAGSVMLAASVAMGAHIGHGIVTVVGVLGLIMLWSMAYSGLFYFIGLRTRSAQAPITLLPLALPLLFSSTALIHLYRRGDPRTDDPKLNRPNSSRRSRNCGTGSLDGHTAPRPGRLPRGGAEYLTRGPSRPQVLRHGDLQVGGLDRGDQFGGQSASAVEVAGSQGDLAEHHLHTRWRSASAVCVACCAA